MYFILFHVNLVVVVIAIVHSIKVKCQCLRRVNVSYISDNILSAIVSSLFLSSPAFLRQSSLRVFYIPVSTYY